MDIYVVNDAVVLTSGQHSRTYPFLPDPGGHPDCRRLFRPAPWPQCHYQRYNLVGDPENPLQFPLSYNKTVTFRDCIFTSLNSKRDPEPHQWDARLISTSVQCRYEANYPEESPGYTAHEHHQRRWRYLEANIVSKKSPRYAWTMDDYD